MHISPVLWQFLVRWLTNSALFPPEASAISTDVDAFYLYLLLISVVGLVAVSILVFGFSIAYRKDRNPVATQIEGSLIVRGPSGARLDNATLPGHTAPVQPDGVHREPPAHLGFSSLAAAGGEQKCWLPVSHRSAFSGDCPVAGRVVRRLG